MKKLIIAGVALVALVVVAATSAIFVDETEYIIITEFGQYKRTLDTPGLALKAPWQTATRVDKRLLASDAPQEEYLTRDKKRLVCDPVVRWRVGDALNYFMKVRDESSARKRLDGIVLSELRQELAKNDFGDIVGKERATLMDNVTERVKNLATELGIDVIDVRIKRADLPTQVQQSVFARMRAERERQAKQYRSEGQEESDKIKGAADKEREIRLAEADEQSDRMRGEGDGEATAIYADAFGRDIEFYSFVRNLELYEKAIDKDATLVVSTDSPLLRYLMQPGKASDAKIDVRPAEGPAAPPAVVPAPIR
ncbi:MAG: protease modulator HflC [Myxococcales bacterium]|nr:protease modulator HflC [Myxococcales bacterium]